MNIVSLIVQVVGGAAGGIGTGRLIRSIDLGTVGNAICGIIGGGLGGQILNMLGIGAMPSGSTDIASIIGNVAAGGVGGGVLMAIVGFVRSIIRR